tara:strand:+ start:1135 stop:1587 length:453 start_codon:yes stop_codon:yes gene_type:complete
MEIFESKESLEAFNNEFMAKIEEEKRSVNKEIENFKKVLIENGVKRFTVYYSGSSDSGEIYDYTVEPSGIKIPDRTWEEFDYKKMKVVSFQGSQDADSYVEDFCYQILQSHHAGWEINEGQNGKFEWNSDENEIVHDFDVITYESHSEEF